MFATVLFPMARSQEAAESVSRALELVQAHNSRLALASVVDPGNPAMAAEAAVAQLLATAQKGFHQAGVACEVVERRGNPAFVICDAADWPPTRIGGALSLGEGGAAAAGAMPL
ncbi:MAG TPA: hypothetical protein DD643_04885 [Synechococcus sp. UBA8638]|nr:hypothetical protein [Synechococcus sp. UBA8638]